VSVVNPRDLLLKQLAELLWIERTLFFEVLPKVHDDAHAPALQRLLTEHRAETRTHCIRVEEALRAAGAEPAAAGSPPFATLAAQHEQDAQAITHRGLRDVFHCAGAARTEHDELACYDAAIGLAGQLGLDAVARLLEQNRDEDAKALEKIEQLARELRRTGLEAGPPHSAAVSP
jgi:ferritin-like metal-binding protein YciE